MKAKHSMSNLVHVRPVEKEDYQAWLPLWVGYNAFYGRHGATALDPHITQTTWARFFDPDEPVNALVAVFEGQLVGLVHYIFLRSTSRLQDCYLQDLFTKETLRGKGVGRRLIEAVYTTARENGYGRVFWLTHETNAAGRMLYDKVAQNSGFIVYTHPLS